MPLTVLLFAGYKSANNLVNHVTIIMTKNATFGDQNEPPVPPANITLRHFPVTHALSHPNTSLLYIFPTPCDRISQQRSKGRRYPVLPTAVPKNTSYANHRRIRRIPVKQQSPVHFQRAPRMKIYATIHQRPRTGRTVISHVSCI